MSSMISKELYYKKMEDENGMDIDNIENTPSQVVLWNISRKGYLSQGGS